MSQVHVGDGLRKDVLLQRWLKQAKFPFKSKWSFQNMYQFYISLFFFFFQKQQAS